MNRRTTVRTFSGWPILAALTLLIVGVLYLTLGRDERTVRVKPASGSAQAMAFAAERAGDQPRR